MFHDDTLNRVCGVDSRVDEKTYDELSKISLCGTTQTIPLFSEVLKTVRGRGPLIVELKNGKRNEELCEKTYALLEKYSGEYCIESFNPFIVRWFKKNAPEVIRGQLANPPKDYNGEVGPIHFTSDHASNYLPLKGTIPDEAPEMIAAIDSALSGETALRPEWLRGL